MGLLWLHGSHISSNMEDLWHVIQQKKDCTYNLQLGQKIFLDVPFDSQSLLSALFTFTQRAADSKACAFLLSAVSARMPLAVRSVIRSSMDHNEKLHASTKSNRDSIYWNPCGDSVSLAYKQWVWFSECYPYVTPPTHEPITCSFFHSKKPLNPPSPSLLPPSFLPLHLLLWTAGSQCVILFIPRFSPLRSPLHPSIPFFHVCSAVKPSWIRPASLVRCSLCWCWNRQC